MLKQIWQRLVRWFRRWFGVDRRRNTTSPTVHQQQPPPLTDTDYEFLFIELLEGVAHGWQQARVLRFFEVLSERGKQELWVAWLRRFGEKLLASSVANDELAARMVQLGELGCGEITEVAYEIGMQLLIKPRETHWENTSVNGEDEREGDSQVEAVINQFNTAIQSIIEEALALYNQGVQQHNAGDLLAAIASYERAIQIHPKFYEAWVNKGTMIFNLERYEDAIASYEQAIEFKPKRHEVWYSRGNVLSKLGRWEEAITNYDKAVQLKPNYHQAWNNRGAALNKLCLYEQAISNFDRALQIKPDTWASWIGRGIAADNLVHPDFRLTSLIAQGNPALKQRNYDGQLASYEEGLKYVHPDTHPEGWGRLRQAIGNAHYDRGSRDSRPFSYWHKAVAEYNEALKTLTEEAFPEAHLEVLQDLIQAALGLGETAEAKELGRRGTDLLRRLLDESKSLNRKKRLAFKFAEFNQLTVDLAVHSGNWCAALELAEQSKNACLSWLLYAGSDEIASPSWSEIKQLLNPTTAIIYWHLSPVALTTFVLKSNAPSPIVITTPTRTDEEGLPARVQHLREFEDWVEDWEQQYTNYRSQAKDEQSQSNHSWREGMKTKLKKLKNILNITAIEQELKGIKQLLLIPHRDLHRFPLHVLFTNKFGFSIAYLPSAQIGINLEKRQLNTINHLLSVEAPRNKADTSLGFAELESEAISQIFDNSKRIQSKHASKRQVEDALSTNYSVFHFTGHGTHNSRNPKKSELALANEDKLTLLEICQNDLTSYNLVSLSACETAITGNQTITTEYVGLVSGFMSRGAAHVVSTLWTVDSAATALVMIEFYRRRQTGKSEASALAEATEWLKELTAEQLKEWYEAFLTQLPPDEGRIRPFLETELDKTLDKTSTMEPDEKLYDHPYYWAAFTITGRLC